LATHWLGDTFWALQIIPFLRRAHPAARLSVLVRPELTWLACLWAPADQVHALGALVSDRLREGWPRPWTIVREAARSRRRIGRPDLLVDLTNTPAAALFGRVLRPRFAIGAGARGWTAGGFDSWRRMQGFAAHLATRPWWVLEPIYRAREAWPSPEEQLRPRLPGDVTPPAPGGGAVQLFPGAGWPEKRWPLERFVALATRLASEGRAVDLLFSPREAALAEESSRRILREGSRAPGISVRVTDGPQLLGALRSAHAVVSNDSGAAHLAAALGRPTLALFGPTDPARCGPLGPRVGLLRGDRPADLGSISVAAVHEALARLLGAAASGVPPAPGASG